MASYPPIDKSFVGQLKDIKERLSQVESRRNRPSLLRGSATERDAIFGVPTTDADRVVLANQRIGWYNTELQWTESYYTNHGLAGLTVPGIVAGYPSGWYPVGVGPWANLDGFAQSRTNNQPTTDYYAWGNNNSQRQSSIITRSATVNPERLILGLAGFYHITANVGFPNGSGTGVASLRSYTPAGVQIELDQRPIPLLAGFGQRAVFDLGIIRYPVNAYALFMTDSATWTITVEALMARYLGPPLYAIPE